MKLSVGRKKLTAVGLGDVAIFAGGFTSDVGSNNCGDRARLGMGCYRREVDLSGNFDIYFDIYFDHLSRMCHLPLPCDVPYLPVKALAPKPTWEKKPRAVGCDRVRPPCLVDADWRLEPGVVLNLGLLALETRRCARFGAADTTPPRNSGPPHCSWGNFCHGPPPATTPQHAHTQIITTTTITITTITTNTTTTDSYRYWLALARVSKTGLCPRAQVKFTYL